MGAKRALGCPSHKHRGERNTLRGARPPADIMIYDTNGTYFKSFLSSNKHKPSSEEVIEALNDIRPARRVHCTCALVTKKTQA